MDYLLLIKIFVLCWTITRFEPISWVLELLPDNLFFNILKTLLSCLKCSMLWIGLIFTHDIFISCGLCLFGFWYDKIIGYYENKIKL